MEFIEYLDKAELEILEMVVKAGYKAEENSQLCLLSDSYVGFLKKKEKVIIICTNNVKKKVGYTLLKKKNDDYFQRSALHIKKALRHEAVHVAQECNNGKLLDIDKKLSIRKSKLKALHGSIKISGEEDREIQAYILEDKPRIVKKELKKYCL